MIGHPRTRSKTDERNLAPASDGDASNSRMQERTEQTPRSLAADASWMDSTSLTSTPIATGITRVTPGTSLATGVAKVIPGEEQISVMSKEQAQLYALKSAEMIDTASHSLMKAIKDKAELVAKNKALHQELNYSNGIAKTFLDAPPAILAQEEADLTPRVSSDSREDTARSYYFDNDRDERNKAFERRETLKRTVPNYSGEDTVSIISYLKQFKIVRKEFQWTDQVAGFHLVRALTGKAVQVLRDMSDEDQGFEAVSKALVDKFEPSTQVDAYRNQFEYRIRDSRRETPHQYAEILKTIASKAFSFMDNTAKEYLIRKQFEKGQTVEIKRMLAGNPDLGTVDSCVAMVSKYEACLSSESMRRVGMKPTENPHVPTVNVTEVQELDELPVYQTEEESESTHDVNYAVGKFNPARKTTGPRQGGYKDRNSNPRGRSTESFQPDPIQKLEDKLNNLMRSLESSNPGLGYNQTALGLPKMANVSQLENYAMQSIEDGPTVHELMVLMGGNSLACWFCQVQGHRYTSCELFRKWLAERKNGKEGPLPPLPPSQTYQKKGN